jgi:hypothetical protein
MAQKFLSPINVVSGTSYPATASAGDLFFRSDLGAMYTYDGSAWTSMTATDITNVDGGNATSAYNINYDGGTPSSF